MTVTHSAAGERGEGRGGWKEGRAAVSSVI